MVLLHGVTFTPVSNSDTVRCSRVGWGDELRRLVTALVHLLPYSAHGFERGPLSLIEQRSSRRGVRHCLDCDDTVTGLGMISEDFWLGMRASGNS